MIYLLKELENNQTKFQKAIQNSYFNGITDEFIKPIVKIDEDNNPISNHKRR